MPPHRVDPDSGRKACALVIPVSRVVVIPWCEVALMPLTSRNTSRGIVSPRHEALKPRHGRGFRQTTLRNPARRYSSADLSRHVNLAWG